MLKELKQWTKGEIIFYSIVFAFFALTMIVAGIILDFRVHFILFGIFAIASFILAAKKTVVGYMLAIVTIGLYAVFAYINNYFSEMIAVGLFVLPYLIVEIIRWCKQKTNKPTLPQGKRLIIEICLAVACAGLLFFGAYKLLYVLQNSWHIGSTFAVVAAAGFLCGTTYAQKLTTSVFLTAYLALASVCWIYCAAFTDISYAAVALAVLAMFVVSVRLLVNNAKVVAKQRKVVIKSQEEKQTISSNEEVEIQAEQENEEQSSEDVATADEVAQSDEVDSEEENIATENPVVEEKPEAEVKSTVKRRRNKKRK